MKKTWLILSLLSVTIAGIAQNKRELVIGIDAYIKTGNSTRSTFGNLKGCRNDEAVLKLRDSLFVGLHNRLKNFLQSAIPRSFGRRGSNHASSGIFWALRTAGNC
jgi:hypothetical protein